MDELQTHLTEYRKRTEQLKAALARLEAQAQAVTAQINASMGAIQALERLEAELAKSSEPSAEPSAVGDAS